MALDVRSLRQRIRDAGHTWVARELPPGEPAHGLGWSPTPAERMRPALEAAREMVDERGPRLAGKQRGRTLRPASFDWRTRGAIATAGDQGYCGACVSFAVCGLIAAMAKIETGLDIDLSEADSHFCSSHGATCGGWNTGDALGQAKTRGIVAEAAFQYMSAFDSPPKGNPNDPDHLWLAHCRASDRSAPFKVLNSTAWDGDARKDYLANVGPLVAGFTVYEDFDHYAGGVYHHVAGKERGGHAVLVIGYSDAEQAWICRNSWGTGFGGAARSDGTGGGFFKIGYGECGIESHAFFGCGGVTGGKGPTEIWRGQWTGGWSVIVPLQINGAAHLFEYKGGDGTVAIDKVAPDGRGTTELWRSRWSTGWTSIVPMQVGSSAYLFEYKSGDGTVAIDKVAPDGRGTTEVWRSRWSTGWTSIVPMQVGSSAYLFEYKSGDGTVAIDKVAPDGRGTTEVWRSRWSTGWTTIVPIQVAGATYLLEYKARDGTIAIDKVAANALGTSEIWRSAWTTGWSAIVPTPIGGAAYVFDYKVGDGTAAIDKLVSSGAGTREQWRGAWTTGWTTILPLQAGGKSLLFEYKSGDGTVAIDTVTPWY